MQVPLDVYIYYDNLPVTWSMEKAEYIDMKPANGSQWVPANLRSTYDAVNYAATIGSNERLYIKLAIDANYPGHGLTMRIANADGTILSPLNAYINNDGDRVVIEWNPPDTGTTPNGTFIKDTTFIVLLKVEYSYFNGFKTMTAYNRNILVYGANVVRQK